MTVMFTVDATTAENGCLEVVPGSHINDYGRRILPQEKHDGSIALDWCGKQEWVPVHCQPVSNYDDRMCEIVVGLMMTI